MNYPRLTRRIVYVDLGGSWHWTRGLLRQEKPARRNKGKSVRKKGGRKRGRKEERNGDESSARNGITRR